MSSILDQIQSYLQSSSYQLNHFEEKFFGYVDQISPTESIQNDNFHKQVLGGGYVFIADNGQSYDLMMNYGNDSLINRDNSSSHHSIDTQYAVRGYYIGECLFGTKEIDGQKGSWFQLEAYTTELWQLPAHLVSYIGYFISGYNCGPYGYSPHTESSPYILDMDPTPIKDTQPLAELASATNESIGIDIKDVITLATSDELHFEENVAVAPPAPVIEVAESVIVVQNHPVLPIIQEVICS
jgi:hypothetical protein